MNTKLEDEKRKKHMDTWNQLIDNYVLQHNLIPIEHQYMTNEKKWFYDKKKHCFWYVRTTPSSETDYRPVFYFAFDEYIINKNFLFSPLKSKK